MDSRPYAYREDIHDVQLELRNLYATTSSHNERLARLEKRQADDAAMKAPWNSPFPSAIGGTPQHGQYYYLYSVRPSIRLVS